MRESVSSFTREKRTPYSRHRSSRRELSALARPLRTYTMSTLSGSRSRSSSTGFMPGKKFSISLSVVVIISYFRWITLKNRAWGGHGRLNLRPFQGILAPYWEQVAGKHSCFLSPVARFFRKTDVFPVCGHVFFSAFGACFWQRALWLVSCFCSRCKST